MLLKYQYAIKKAINVGLNVLIRENTVFKLVYIKVNN
jgi:hypothetical protein